MVEQGDTAGLKPADFGHAGSIPARRTSYASVDKLVKSSLSKGEIVQVQILPGAPKLFGTIVP